ncbi:hypothetical protein QQF64_020304 [Cirrhinus molitorella]|uniref:Sterile alpha motif domain-containing 3-like n=1 Tax=Cirrhinus molitorella TaxID=172907 RepID=A0ABR3LCA0_9TELE
MRYKAKHSFFKQVSRHTKCFKNVPLSLAVKHQLMISYYMRPCSLQKPDFEAHDISTISVDVLNQAAAEKIKLRYPSASEVHLTKSVISKGVEFRNGMVVAQGSTSGLPDFCEILQICLVQERICFIVKRLLSCLLPWICEDGYFETIPDYDRLGKDMAPVKLRGNSAFRTNVKCLIPDPKLKSGILDALAEEIINYKAYPSDSEFSDVAEALVAKHPCLKEQGSASGYSGWKMSLKFKLANYRSKLRRLGCPEVTVNALKYKPEGKHSPAYGIKNPKKAEVNYCPAFPAGEIAESQEKMRVELLAELKKRNNDETVRKMMDMTFAYRRHEVVHNSPLVVDFRSRWPALFQVREINAEFRWITTLPLQSKFLSQLDRFSDDLLKVFTKRGGVVRKRIQDVMVPMSQNATIETKRECILKGLCIYLNEDPQDLVREYLDVEPASNVADIKNVLGICVVKHEFADATEDPEDIGIVLEGVEMLSGLGNVALATAMLLGLIYSLNLTYPHELRYAFEVLQKIILELNSHKLSAKAQALKTKLFT